MGKKLAIKGHSTRGKEVIELLEMLGGKNIHNLYGNNSFEYYVSGHAILNDRLSIIEDDDFVIFNLEEFLKEYPFKIGDKVKDCYGNTVTIKSMEWSEDCETMVYDFKDSVIVLAAADLLKYNAEFLVNKEKSEEVGKMLCDRTLNHLHRNSLKNVLSELYEHIKTTPKEDLEREFEEISEWSNVGPTVEEFRTFCECVNKKPKYPDNYEECAEIMDVDLWNTLWGESATEYEEQTEGLINAFIKLKVCRDAYWKIAGEETGLGKPWEPNEASINAQYGIRPLLFPSKEIYNIFYDNFKDLIEQCKELL